MSQLNVNSETGTQESQQANSDASLNKPARAAVRTAEAQGTQQVSKTPVESEEPKALSLAELFGDEHPDSENNQDVDDPSKPVESIDSLVKRLGVKPEQVYSIKVPMPNGAEPLTIGDLKDRVGELVGLDQRELQFDQRRVKAEGELLRAQTEMRELLATIPKEHIKPEMVDKIRKRHETTMRREREMTLEHIPQWQDEEVRTTELQGIVDMLSDYGFDESFITTVVDHRALKFMRDMFLRDKRIKAALSKVTIPVKKGQRPSSKTGKPAVKPNAQTQRRNVAADQRSRIMAIFNED